MSHATKVGLLHLMQVPGMGWSRALPAAWAAACVTAAASLLWGAAQAQEPAAEQEPAAFGGLEEMVVTARRREEGLQDTPISITAFSADSLEQRQITDISGIGQFTPNMMFDRAAAIGGSNSSAIVYIRGVGQDAAIPTIDLGVGTYIDGVYLARSVGGVLDLVDVERIEVLRGPQGTLFGRNTIGGAINITSRKPDENFGGHMSLTMGSDRQINNLLTVSGPLAEQVFGRVSVLSKSRDGFVQRFDGTDMGNEKMLAGRIALRWLAGDALEFNLAVDATNRDEKGAPFVLTDVDLGADFVNFHNAFVAPPEAGCFDFDNGVSTESPDPACFNSQWVQRSGSDRDAGTLPARDDIDVYGVALTAEWQLNDALTLKSITSYRDTRSRFVIDQDHSPHTIAHVTSAMDQDQWAEEIQLLGESFSRRLNWILGAYYFRETGSAIEEVAFAPVRFQSGGDFENDSIAFFAQGSMAITDRLSLTAGLRFTEDTKRFTPDQFIISNNNHLVPPFLLGQPGGPPELPPPGFPILPQEQARLKVSETTPLVTLAYSWTSRLMTYATYSEGFKSGGFIQRIFPPEPSVRSFDPEYVDSYELGFKWTGLGNRLRLNGAAFHADYTDLQFVVQSDTVAPVVLNQSAAEIRGVELDLIALPLPNLTIEAGLGYLDAKYTDIDPEVPASLNITTDSKLVKAPKWTGNAALVYTLRRDGIGSFSPRLDVVHRSAYFNNSINSPQIAQDAYWQWDFGVTYKSENELWTVAAIGKNLGDERVASAGFSDTRFLGTSETVLSRGREWALTVKRSF